MAKQKRGKRIAPGLIRVVQPGLRVDGMHPDGIPVTLTLADESPGDTFSVMVDPALITPADLVPGAASSLGDRIGIMAPSGNPPWGCFFFSLVGAVVLVAIWSLNYAIVSGLVGLIVYYSIFNSPGRKSAEDVRRALLLVSHRKAKRARMALRPALARNDDSAGLHYLAALVEIVDGHYVQALEHLDEAAHEMRDYAEFHHMSGRCLAKSGAREEALSALERAASFGAYPARNILLSEVEELRSE